jgi:hypothetical protein
MIFTHPDHRKCKRVASWKQLEIIQLKAAGWIEQPYVERTPKQKAATERWMNSGQLARTKVNLQDCIRRERNNLSKEQMRILNNAEIVLQQLSKKYRPATK